jgi:hypothetical protein
VCQGSKACCLRRTQQALKRQARPLPALLGAIGLQGKPFALNVVGRIALLQAKRELLA